MDYYSTVPLGSPIALPKSTNSLGGPRPLEAQHIAIEYPGNITAPRGKVITEADWPALKPVIHRLWIRENLTFPKVKKVLNIEFGFNITKRQFTRKTKEWDFRKNFRKDEREEILKSEKIPERLIHDSRVNQKRVQRLKKRSGVRMSLGYELEKHGNEMPLTQGSISTQTIRIVKEDLEIQNQNMTLEEHDMVIKEIPNLDDQGDTVMTGTMDPWPFSQAADESSRILWLTELFAQLEIAILESANLDNKTVDHVEEKQFISGMELKELSKSCDKAPLCVKSYSAQQHDHHRQDFWIKNATLQARNASMSQYSWSPLLEIDVFPKLGDSNRCSHNSLIHMWKSLERKSAEFHNRLSRLDQLLPANLSVRILNLERLASVYQEISTVCYELKRVVA
ncbi:hypothetical protein NHQ30_009227 [Ciborinia camelliae]|nr:hypothetical protein NHQ30_009227 [Ciborinia camelliae]